MESPVSLDFKKTTRINQIVARPTKAVKQMLYLNRWHHWDLGH